MISRLLAACWLVALTSTMSLGGTWKDVPEIGRVQGGDVNDDGTAVGWQVAYEFNDFISMEFSLTAHEDQLRQDDFEDVSVFPPDGQIDLQFYDLALTGRAAFCPIRRVYVYGGIGAGFYVIHEDAEDVREALAADPETGPNGGQITTLNIQIDDSFGFHVAAGVEVLLSEAWEIFGEFRAVYLTADSDVTYVETLPVEDVGKSKVTTKTPFTDFDYDFNLIRFGVNYRF